MRRLVVQLGLTAAVVALVGGVPPAEALKVYVSVDMEGISGVVDGSQVTEDGRDFAAARRWMAEDVNAVIAGLLAAGATEIVVNDSHGGMRNLLPDMLHPAESLISGTPKPLTMMAGIDETFDAVVFVGYHARAGTEKAILDHTIAGRVVSRVIVNGVEMPEMGLNAAIAGELGVPVILVTGDTATAEQARSLLGEEVVTVAVKEALGRNAGRLLPMAEARRRLEEGARRALANRSGISRYCLDAPFRFEVTFLTSAQAELGTLIPGVERTDARTLAFTAEPFTDGFKLLRALIALGATR